MAMGEIDLCEMADFLFNRLRAGDLIYLLSINKDLFCIKMGNNDLF